MLIVRICFWAAVSCGNNKYSSSNSERYGWPVRTTAVQAAREWF